jgi:cytochrome c5
LENEIMKAIKYLSLVICTALVAPVAIAASAAPSAADLAKGEKVFKVTCVVCHGAGILGAPKFGDKAAWASRIAQGADTLHAHALSGLKTMPPKGGNTALKDDEVKAAVDYMVDKAR